MGIDKHDLKGGGGYVGGFLQLFDWNAKSRKKLFSSKSDLSGIQFNLEYEFYRMHKSVYVF